MRIFIAIFKFILFASFLIFIVPIQAVVLLFTKDKPSYILPQFFHRVTCFIFGIRIYLRGSPAFDHHLLFMSNHVSYLDIPVLGSIIKSSFVAKSEVSGWAVFGFLSTLQQTAFIKRKRTAITREAGALQQRIEGGESLIIFPEGTSTDGLSVDPFKSSLFSLSLLESAPDIMI